MKNLLVLILVAVALVGCSGNDPAAAPVGETTVSKAGEAQMKENGGKPLPKQATNPDL